jgi:DNA polymerase sigma
MHIWNTCKHHPTHSSLSDSIQRAMYSGNRWMWWKNSALLLHLDSYCGLGTDRKEKKKKSFNWKPNHHLFQIAFRFLTERLFFRESCLSCECVCKCVCVFLKGQLTFIIENISQRAKNTSKMAGHNRKNITTTIKKQQLKSNGKCLDVQNRTFFDVHVCLKNM